ncbi:hypothetical protein Q3G72_004521 [Acer saccharum]|nr:hypothetical protein Q3G72_004521 [Acer saccharum]
MPEIIPFKGNCRGYGIAILAVLIPENLVGMEEEEELSIRSESRRVIRSEPGHLRGKIRDFAALIHSGSYYASRLPITSLLCSHPASSLRLAIANLSLAYLSSSLPLSTLTAFPKPKTTLLLRKTNTRPGNLCPTMAEEKTLLFSGLGESPDKPLNRDKQSFIKDTDLTSPLQKMRRSSAKQSNQTTAARKRMRVTNAQRLYKAQSHPLLVLTRNGSSIRCLLLQLRSRGSRAFSAGCYASCSAR